MKNNHGNFPRRENNFRLGRYFLVFALAVFAVNAERAHAIEYGGNIVDFNIGSEEHRLTWGKYTVTDFEVSKGWFLEPEIRRGMEIDILDRRLVFDLGHRGSEETTRWLVDTIGGEENTYGYLDKQFNFAVIGKLDLEVNGEARYSFDDIAIAQGHIGNQWWIGGKNCRQMAGDKVSCPGKGWHASKPDTFTRVNMVFKRGDRGNLMTIEDGLLPPAVRTENWMGTLADKTKLGAIMMPGSRHAGMSELSHCTRGKNWARTQQLSVAEQLAAGVRYLDFQVDYNRGRLVTSHRTDILGIVGFGCDGQDLIDVLKETVDFLRAHPSETVMLKIDHARRFRGHDPDEIKEKINALLDQWFISYVYKHSNSDVNLGQVPLGSARGKMVLVFDYDDFIEPRAGKFRYWELSDEDKLAGNLHMYSSDSGTDDYEAMAVDQVEKWNEQGGKAPYKWFLLSWVLTTSSFSDISTREISEIANGKLYHALSRRLAAGAPKPNIVCLDFINTDLAAAIIELNKRY